MIKLPLSSILVVLSASSPLISFMLSVYLSHLEHTEPIPYAYEAAKAQLTVLEVSDLDVIKLIYPNASAVKPVVFVYFPKSLAFLI
jgi:hypothetical protein